MAATVPPLPLPLRPHCPAARNFKLLDELEQAEKPKDGRGAEVSLGKAFACMRALPGLVSLPSLVRSSYCVGIARGRAAASLHSPRCPVRS